MKKIALIFLSIFTYPVFVFSEGPSEKFQKNWPQWRGPLANGIVLHGNPPIEWSESKNVKWKIDVPGFGHATPIIWDDQIFVLTAIETDKAGKSNQETQNQGGRRGWRPRGNTTSNIYQFKILSINRASGKIRWQKTAREEMPHQGTHQTGSWSSSSPVTDGEHVYAYFGSRGLYCYDMQGNLKWEKDFGDMDIKLGFGEGISPALLDSEKLYFLKTNDAILSCFNSITGEKYYGPERLEDMKTVYASPVIAEDRIYLFDRSGTGLVIEHGPEFKVLAKNTLDDGFTASPAIVGNEMFLRGHETLYCIAEE